MKIKELTAFLESIAPPSFQESYDNVGLIIGDPERDVQSALVTLDITPAVLDEALQKNAGLIISHHPLIFQGLKKIAGRSEVERMVARAIRQDLAIFAAHTNLDAITGGVNTILGDTMGLREMSVLRPMRDALVKLVTFVPEQHADEVRQALFGAGAGVIGDYDSCSYNLQGEGSFKAGASTDPFVGEKGRIHFEKEVRIETILPRYLKQRVVDALVQAHPYDEVAYDLYPLENEYPLAGMGMVGTLPEALPETDFLDRLKQKLGLRVLKHTELRGNDVEKVAVCGGSGSFLIEDAIRSGADVFVSGDFKYHDFFKAEKKLVLVDIGHYESEHYVKEIFSALIRKKFPTFAVQISEVNTNPVNFY
jgi:dinuclear metal center YbgI/SA1388 family protein